MPRGEWHLASSSNMGALPSLGDSVGRAAAGCMGSCTSLGLEGLLPPMGRLESQ